MNGRRTLLSFLPLLALLVLLPGGAVHADDAEPDPKATFFQGTHAFRRVLANAGLTSLINLAEVPQDPSGTILIVLGRGEVLREMGISLEDFVRQGGALMLASDQPVRDRVVAAQLIKIANVSIEETSIRARIPEFRYRGYPYCPIIHAAPRANPNLFRNPTLAGLPNLQVATNVPSDLRQGPEGFPRGVGPLSYLPPNCDRETKTGKDQLPNQPLFGVGGNLGKGRLLVLADHSIFINAMMLQRDNGNVEFAVNCVNWLAGDNGERKRVLLLEDGMPQTHLNVPVKDVRMSIPPDAILDQILRHPSAFLGAVENELTRAEQQDAFNRALLEALDDGLGLPPHKLVWVVVGVLTVFLLVYAIYRIGMRGRLRTEPRLLALGDSAPAPGGPSLITRRQLEMLREANVAEPAREAARLLLLDLGGNTHSPPLIRTQAGWWRRRHLTSLVRTFWDLARGVGPARITPQQLPRVLANLEAIQQAVQAGELELVWNSGERGHRPPLARGSSRA